MCERVMGGGGPSRAQVRQKRGPEFTPKPYPALPTTRRAAHNPTSSPCLPHARGPGAPLPPPLVLCY